MLLINNNMSELTHVQKYIFNNAFVLLCEKGKLDIAKSILNLGVSVDAVDDVGYTACFNAASSDSYETLEFLLNNDADPDKALTDGGSTPCYIASAKGNIKSLELLLSRGANPNKSRPDGHSPCEIAVHNNNIDVLKLLIRYSATPSKQSFAVALKQLNDALELDKIVNEKTLSGDELVELKYKLGYSCSDSCPSKLDLIQRSANIVKQKHEILKLVYIEEV